jgi:hypothetical protein
MNPGLYEPTYHGSRKARCSEDARAFAQLFRGIPGAQNVLRALSTVSFHFRLVVACLRYLPTKVDDSNNAWKKRIAMISWGLRAALVTMVRPAQATIHAGKKYLGLM